MCLQERKADANLLACIIIFSIISMPLNGDQSTGVQLALDDTEKSNYFEDIAMIFSKGKLKCTDYVPCRTVQVSISLRSVLRFPYH